MQKYYKVIKTLVVFGCANDPLAVVLKLFRDPLLIFNTVWQVLSILLILLNCLQDLGRSLRLLNWSPKGGDSGIGMSLTHFLSNYFYDLMEYFQLHLLGIYLDVLEIYLYFRSKRSRDIRKEEEER